MTDDPILIELAGLTLKESVGRILDRVLDARKQKRTTRKSEQSTLVQKLLNSIDYSAFSLHVRDAYSWASIIHVQGMGAPLSTTESTVPLDYSQIARRFREPGSGSQSFDEATFLQSQANFLILGDPGAGKTTSLRRLVLSVLDQSQPDAEVSKIRFPVVIVCRELTQGFGDALLECFGTRSGPVRLAYDGNESTDLLFAAAVLDELNAVLVVDGVDEIPQASDRNRLLDSLNRLGRMCSAARIIVSSRSGDAPHLDGFLTGELLPLTETQVLHIARQRTSQATEFLDAIHNGGYHDVVDRPLFLDQLLRVYTTSGVLPERPVDLARQLVRLLLNEWDQQRRVVRRSAYATFDNGVKQEVLSEIAFYLTMSGKTRFQESDLIEIYDRIADPFGLPVNGALTVVREIESHVGIIAEIPNGFEFTHLTLQEFLCADHISRQTMNDDVAQYLQRYPEVVAVAVALSSRPGPWLIECVRRARSFDTGMDAGSFAGRLGLEQPRFTPSLELGESIIRLMAQGAGSAISSWNRLLATEAVRESLNLTTSRFRFVREGAGVRVYRRDPNDRMRRIGAGLAPIPAGIAELATEDLEIELF
jgi:hypothetical protein